MNSQFKVTHKARNTTGVTSKTTRGSTHNVNFLLPPHRGSDSVDTAQRRKCSIVLALSPLPCNVLCLFVFVVQNEEKPTYNGEGKPKGKRGVKTTRIQAVCGWRCRTGNASEKPPGLSSVFFSQGETLMYFREPVAMLAKQQAAENPKRRVYSGGHTQPSERGTFTIPAPYPVCHARVAHTKQRNAKHGTVKQSKAKQSNLKRFASAWLPCSRSRLPKFVPLTKQPQKGGLPLSHSPDPLSVEDFRENFLLRSQHPYSAPRGGVVFEGKPASLFSRRKNETVFTFVH